MQTASARHLILAWHVSQIEDKVSKCAICSQFQRAQPREPMLIQELPDRPIGPKLQVTCLNSMVHITC